MSADHQHLVYHRGRVAELEHELALARASAAYWREKYIHLRDACNVVRPYYVPPIENPVEQEWIQRQWENAKNASAENARAWYELARQS